MSERFQPRWQAFIDSGVQLKPEGSQRNVQFMGWITAKWRQWRDLSGIPDDAPLTDDDHAAFDAWLRQEVYDHG